MDLEEPASMHGSQGVVERTPPWGPFPVPRVFSSALWCRFATHGPPETTRHKVGTPLHLGPAAPEPAGGEGMIGRE